MECQENNFSFYLLVRLLHDQAQLIHMQARLISEEKVKRRQRSTYRQMQESFSSTGTPTLQEKSHQWGCWKNVLTSFVQL